MSRAAGPALGVRRSAFKWILSECSLTRLGPSKASVNTRQEPFPRTPFRGSLHDCWWEGKPLGQIRADVKLRDGAQECVGRGICQEMTYAPTESKFNSRLGPLCVRSFLIRTG